jgi:transcriptional regulator with XRE-family HTH domain
VEDIEQARADAGISARALARASGVDAGFLCRILAGEAHPSLDTYARLSGVLGLDLALRAYPNTGPLIRDRHQARILELLLATLHPRWKPYAEVAVRQPSRGWIDAVLHDAAAALLVATEIQSELRRLEQIVRWSAEKAASLPSWDGWTPLGGPRTSQLLIVRRTRATRHAAGEFERQLRLAFPAHPDDALAALAGTSVWPGPALLWASIDARGTRIVHGR